MATLELPDLTQLTNDPISHSPWWSIIPTKLPADILKFNGNPREDPSTHAITYHLWCSSNSLNDDSIRLRMFQQMLIGTTTKWYIELLRVSFQDFITLATTFLTHFQFPIKYKNRTKLFTNFKQSNSTHISNKIHEWRHYYRLTKTYVLE